MKLNEWCTRGRGSALAEQLGLSRTYIYRLAAGRCRPSVELAGRISAATAGEVTVEDLLGKLPPGGEWSEVARDLRAEREYLDRGAMAMQTEKRPQAEGSAMRPGAAA